MYIAMKDFEFSRDGIHLEAAEKGKPVDIPENLIKGLVNGRFIAAAGDHKKPAEEAVVEDVKDEPKDDEAKLEAVRERYQEVVGKRPYWGWSVEELDAKIAEHEASK